MFVLTSLFKDIFMCVGSTKYSITFSTILLSLHDTETLVLILFYTYIFI